MTSSQQRPVRVGVQIRPQRTDYASIRRTVAAAEELGADAVFNWDHFFPIGRDREGRHFECWTMLAAWAEATSRVEIGALVTAVGFRNPDLLADMARTVDHISDGRLILGIGSGRIQKDYDEYGYEFGTDGSRLDDLAEALPRVERRFARLDPAPTRKIPVLIGGSGEKRTLPLVARHADIWHTFADGDEFARKSAVLDRYCADIGRDPAEIERSVLAGPALGTPGEAGPRARALGASLFIVGADASPADLGVLRDWIAWRDEQNR